MKTLQKTLGTLGLVAGAYSAAFAQDEVIKKQSDLEATIEQAPILERTGGPISILTRGYTDGHGNYQSHAILQNGFGKIAYRDETGTRIYGADLKLENWRLNLGTQTFQDSSKNNGRILVEKSYKESMLDFWNIEYQDNIKENNLAGAAGLTLGKFKPQLTADNNGNFGYALIFNDNENFGIAVGGHRVNDINAYNISSNYTFTEGTLEGYKLWARTKIFESTQGRAGIEGRIQLGDTTPGGAFVAGVQDTLFNSITPFLGADGDATFPFGIGDGDSRFDFFGAASCTSGKAGKIGADIKYIDNATEKSLNTNVAIGLGSISETFLKNNKLQLGYKTFVEHTKTTNDLASLEYRTTLLGNSDNSLSLDLGIRLAKPEKKKTETAAVLALTYNF
ncbi:MAG: hypothetical protein Q7R96_05600 [Nanoarchaeota archaeon]|nr:hypothetical protein [Nanoarchaeota archaeon]